jgi:3-hydroxyisobutyrate dehydrogenase
MLKPNVGVIGLGAMGMGVARSLLRAGFTVAACDVRAEARAAIEAAGGTAYETAAEVGKSSSVSFRSMWLPPKMSVMQT